MAARGNGKPYLDQYVNFADVSATTTACPPVPAPRNLSWTADETSVSLDWDGPAGVALEDIVFYRVDQRQGGTWRIVAYTQKTETTYTRTGLSPGTTYNFRVAARGRGKPYLDEYELFAATSAATTVPARVDPVVSISARPTSVTEGGTITFTVAADTAPTSGLPVSVTVSGAEEFVTGTTPSPVTIPADETSVSFRVETEDDCRDETNGTVTATLSAGTGYTVGNPGSASASVTDNDQPPSVSVSVSSASVRAGDSVTFTVTSDCAPADPLRVNVEVTQVGSFVTTPFPSFWTIPINGLGDSFPLTTRPAAAGEVAGSVTAAIRSGAGYQVGTPSSATAGILVPDTAPPPALVEADAGERSVDLTWNVVTDGARYQVERSLDNANWSVVATPTVTRHEETGLACNETYYFRVATKGDGTRYSTNYGVPSASVPATTTAPCPTAPAPTGLDGTATRTSVRLTWSPRTHVVAYEIKYRERASSASWTTVEQGGTSYPATGLTCGTEYTFSVSAGGDGSPYSTTYGTAAAISRTTSTCPPAPAPGGLSAEAGRRSVRLTWDARVDVVEYRIEYRESTSSDPWTTVMQGGVSYAASGLICDGEDGREYTFRVSARGDGSPYSTTYGTAAVVMEEPECPTLPDADAPDGLVVAASGQTSITLQWNDVEHAVSYLVERPDPDNLLGDWIGVDEVVDDANATTYQLTADALECGTVYVFRVRAVGDGTNTAATLSDNTAQWSPAPVTAACPDAPAPTLSLDRDQYSLTLTWGVVAGVTGYKVEQLQDSLTVPWLVLPRPQPAEAEHTTSGLKCNTSYTFRVSAKGDGTPYSTTYGTPSQLAGKTTDCPRADAPDGLTGVASRTTVSLGWNSVTDAHGYQVEYREKGNSSWIAGPETRFTYGSVGGLMCETEYQFQVLAKGDGWPLSESYGPPSEMIPRTTTDCAVLSGPASLEVEPLPEQKIKLVWSAVTPPAGTTATRYRIEARGTPRVPGGSATDWIVVSPAGENVSRAIDFQGLMVSVSDPQRPGQMHQVPLTLANFKHVALRVRGEFTTTSGDEFTRWTTVNVVDNPLVLGKGQAYGNVLEPRSLTDPQAIASLQWDPLPNATYTLRYRHLSGNHWDSSWEFEADSYGAWESGNILFNSNAADGTKEATVSSLSNGALYAVQLSYTAPSTTVLGQQETFWSGREAFVWASTGRPDSPSSPLAPDGRPMERVATFPYYGHFPNKTFSYRICDEDDFPSTMPTADRGDWAAAIEAGISVWSTATAGLIQTSRSTEDCPPPIRSGIAEVDISDISCDGDGFWAFILRPYCQQGLNALVLADLVTQVVESIYNALAVGLVLNTENDVSEVRIVDTSVPKDLEVITNTYKLCILSASHSACVTSPAYFSGNKGGNAVSSADIFINWGKIKNRGHRIPDEVHWNTCLPSSGNYRFYRLIVHEAGHALGLSGASLTRSGAEIVIAGLLAGAGSAVDVLEWIQQGDSPGTILARLGLEELEEISPELDYAISHASVSPSVMDYSRPTLYSDCAPYPLDILAINALYQEDY